MLPRLGLLIRIEGRFLQPEYDPQAAKTLYKKQQVVLHNCLLFPIPHDNGKIINLNSVGQSNKDSSPKLTAVKNNSLQLTTKATLYKYKLIYHRPTSKSKNVTVIVVDTRGRATYL